jgi:hypothetical protein
MKEQFTYQDFDLLIEPGPPGSYRARVLRSPAGESGPVQFMLPFSDPELENFVLKVSQSRRRTRGAGRPESAPLKEFGGKLYEAVFQGELRDVLQSGLSRTREQRAGMRLRLRLADTPKLAELPWEFLYDRRHNRFLAQSRRTPLVRYLDLPDPPHPLSVEGPLRLLVMISSPSGYPALDVEQEWAALTGALARQQREGRVVIERLAANMSMLRRRLRQDEFHVFHFVGHGMFRPDWGDGVLVMEDGNGGPREVTGEELGGLLNEYDATRIAVLNACEGARTGVSDPFAGMAQSLIQQGLPAVVAMQFEITDEAAIVFARELYGAIADGSPLEAALADARGAIRDEGNPTEWGTPVLYSRAPDGHLFDLTARPQVAQAGRQGKEEAGHEATPLTQRAPPEPDSSEPAGPEYHGPVGAGRLQFRLFTGELVEATARVDDVEFPAGEFLIARKVRLEDGTELRQHRPASGSQRRDGYGRLDNQILAGRRLYEVADRGSYPPEVACLYGDEANSAEPYALFEPYRGQPLREVGTNITDDEFDDFLRSLLTGLCWLAAAGLAHRAIDMDTVLWDSHRRRVQIVDFSRSTVFGVPRTPVTGSPAWVPREQRPGTCYGTVGPRDDIWAAGKAIFFVRNHGEDLVHRAQIADSGLDRLFNTLFGRVFGPPEGRPTAWDLAEYGLRWRSPVPRAADGSARLIAGRERFLQARQRRHPGAPEPPGFNEDIDWMDDAGTARPSAQGNEVPSAAANATPAGAGPAYATGRADETQARAPERADDKTAETSRSRSFRWRRGD